MAALPEAGLWAGFVAELGRFTAAVDWSQRWLWALGGYLGAVAAALVATRRRPEVQGAAFVLCLLAVVLAQPLNALARAHWPVFASANYFGERGFFVSIMWSLPHLLLATLALINLLIGTASLAATVKRMQFQHERNQKNKKKQ